MKTTTTKTIYKCPQGLVTIVRKISGLGRYPRHDYPCILVQLHSQVGTRVRTLTNGDTEFMPSHDELRELLIAIDPTLAESLPTWMKNKSAGRKKFYDDLNAKRHGTQGNA